MKILNHTEKVYFFLTDTVEMPSKIDIPVPFMATELDFIGMVKWTVHELLIISFKQLTLNTEKKAAIISTSVTLRKKN